MDIPYRSHVPILATCVMRTTGPVLEMGAGDCSTLLLSVICKGREVLTVDNDQNWINQLSPLRTNTHKILHVLDWNAFYDSIKNKYWDVIFVDHSPSDWRKHSVERLKNNAKWLVVHDTEPAAAKNYGFEFVLQQFKYRFDWRKGGDDGLVVTPWTTVVSMTDKFTF